MNYNHLITQSEKLEELFLMERKIFNLLSSDDALKYRRIIHKNLVIEIYTFWENFAKELIFHFYKKYKKVIVNTMFIKRYLKSVQANSHIRNVFLGNITDDGFNITIDSLCHSNNLSYSVLTELYKKICFDLDDFSIHVKESIELDTAISELKSNSVDPIFDEEKPPYSKLNYVKGYLEVLVRSRNIVAHQYQVTEIFKIDQLQSISKFVVALCSVMIEYCSSQVIKKSIEKEESISKRMFPKAIFRSNTQGGTALLWIRSYSKTAIHKESDLFAYDKSTGIYKKVEIRQIMDNHQKVCDQILPYVDYSIEVSTECKIRKRHQTFNVCALQENIPEYSYSISI